MTTQGGTSRIAYLQKIREGTVFSEGWENDNWLSAEGWVTLQGNPANTSNQYKAGIKSFDCAALVPGTTTQSLPVVKKVITDTNVGKWYTSIWFYDDATNTTDQGPYFKVKTSSGQFLQVGVRNGTSTTKYVKNIAATYTEDNFSASSVNRSTGWHEFSIYITDGGGSAIEIDGTIVFGGTGSDYVSEIYVQANTVGGSGNSFGYFDALNYNRDQYLTIFYDGNDVPSIVIFDDEFEVITFESSSGPNYIKMPFPQGIASRPIGNTNTYPLSVYLEFYQVTQAGNVSAALRTTTLQVNPGDYYNYVLIDFGRKFTSMQTTDNALANQNRTAQGVREVINFGLQDQHSFTVNQLEGNAWRRKADNFFYYAREGQPFSVMVDDRNDNALGVVSSLFLSGTNYIEILPNGHNNQTDDFDVNDFFVIQTRSNSDKQVLTLSSKDTCSMTFIEDLNFDVNIGDYIYSQFFFPFQQLPQTNLQGFQLTNVQNKRYSWTLPTEDFIEG